MTCMFHVYVSFVCMHDVRVCMIWKYMYVCMYLGFETSESKECFLTERMCGTHMYVLYLFTE